MNINYFCPNCKKGVELEVDVESPSDYYLLDDSCPECNTKLPDSINDIVYKHVTNYYYDKVDYIMDAYRDR